MANGLPPPVGMASCARVKDDVNMVLNQADHIKARCGTSGKRFGSTGRTDARRQGNNSDEHE